MDSRGIYSQSLFKYDDDKVQAYSDQGIELRRSLVNPKYWGKHSFDYLWYGIGTYLRRYPHIRYLFGLVSLSNTYPELEKALIVTLLSSIFFRSRAISLSPFSL